MEDAVLSPDDQSLVGDASVTELPVDDEQILPQQQSPENAADDFDASLEEFAKEDYAFKMKALMGSFSDDMKEIVATFRERQRLEFLEEQKREAERKTMSRAKRILTRGEELARKEAKRLEEEAFTKGVDMQLLRELKIAFEEKVTSDGGAGVDEDEFLKLFGPTLCKGKSEEETRHWFRAIDQNCSGSIQWDEVSNYLVNYHVYADKIRTKREDYFSTKLLEPKGQLTSRKHHRLPIHKTLYSTALDVFYTASHDGMVLVWSPQSLKATQTVHKSSEGLWVYDIAILGQSNRLIVLQSDRSFFVYDCFISQNDLRHELFRVFATQGSTTKTFRDGTSWYECVDRKKLINVTASTADRSLVVERVLPHMRAATLLQPSRIPIRCLDHVAGIAASGIGAGEPIVCGREDGALEFFTLQIVSSVPIAPTMVHKSHSAMVTKVKYAAELNGVISSSLDGTIVVTDVDLRQVVQRLVVNDPSMVKPQMGFEYKTYHNMLLSWTSRTLHVWNALTGARLTQLPEHESPITAASINVDKMQAFVLLESKLVTVWDLRNWRQIGEYFDETPRYCNDTLNFILWSPKHHYLLTGCSEIFALRPREVQERIDAGLVPANRGFVGHLRPIRDARPVSQADHIIAIDSHDVGIWGVQTKKLLAMWKWRDPDDNVTCFAIAPDTVRVAMGTESGILEMYNYACGYRIHGLLHDERRDKGVSSLVFVEAQHAEGPPLLVAGIANTVYIWITPRENEDELRPSSSYRHQDPETVVWWVTCIDTRRHTLAAAFSNGEFHILSAVSMTCNCLVAFRSPADRLLSFPEIPSLFAAAHSDGSVRVYLYDNAMFQLHPLIAFQAAFAQEETVSCMTAHEDKIIVGDSVGTVSVFTLGPLLSRSYVWQDLMMNVGDPFFLNKIREEIVPFVDLVVAFDTHESSVTSVSIADGQLFTTGGDRFLRSWSLEEFTLVTEFGTANASDAFHSFHLTDEHLFLATSVMVGSEPETDKIASRRVSRALSYAKRGSVLATELRRVRLMKYDRQQKEEAGTLPPDEASEAELVQALTREPTQLVLHRRRVSALVGDFVLRDDPTKNEAAKTDASSQSHHHAERKSPTREGKRRAQQLTDSDDAEASSPIRKQRSLAKLPRDVGELRASSLRASRRLVDWTVDVQDVESHPSKRTTPLLPRITSSTGSAGGEVTPLGHSPVPSQATRTDSFASEESTTLLSRSPSSKKVSKYRMSPFLLPAEPSPAIASSGGTSPERTPSVVVSPKNAQARLRLAPFSLSPSNAVVGASPLCKESDRRPLDEVDLFKLVTDHVLKHQSHLVRTIPDKGMHSKLQEVMRIRQEKQEADIQEVQQAGTTGIFFRLNMPAMPNGGQVPPPNIAARSALDILLETAPSASPVVPLSKTNQQASGAGREK